MQTHNHRTPACLAFVLQPEDESAGLGGELESVYDSKNDDTFGGASRRS
jgi:hypothetical protein